MSGELYTVDPETRKYVYPDVLEFSKEPFATVIPHRSPTFKVHRTEGLANAALGHHNQGAKYELKSGVWTKIYEVGNATNCSNCNNPLTDDDYGKTYYGYRGDRLKSPLWKGAKVMTPILCLSCYQAEREVYEEKQKARHFAAEQRRRNAKIK